MMGATGENRQKQDSFLDSTDMNFDKEGGKKKKTVSSSSHKIKLIAGFRYKLIVLYFHSNNNNFEEDGIKFFRLFWSSELFKEEIIKDIYYYKAFSLPPLKVWGYSKQIFKLGILQEFVNAFKDSNTYKLADVPMEYSGFTHLQMKAILVEKKIEFESNGPLSLYIAIDKFRKNPLPDGFTETGNVISIFKVGKNKEKKTELRATYSRPYQIYKKNFEKGKIKVKNKKLIILLFLS